MKREPQACLPSARKMRAKNVTTSSGGKCHDDEHGDCCFACWLYASCIEGGESNCPHVAGNFGAKIGVA
jgi:hypothetical protein